MEGRRENTAEGVFRLLPIQGLSHHVDALGPQSASTPWEQNRLSSLKLRLLCRCVLLFAFLQLPKLAAAQNLAPYQPSGWSDKIVVARTAGTTTDSTNLTPSDTLYVDWAIVNNGAVATPGPFYTNLNVDGTLKNTWNTDEGMNPNTYTSVIGYNIGSLPAGTHTLTISFNNPLTVYEESYTDDQYTKTITVTGTPNLTPYQPSGWSDKIVVTTSGTSTTDSSLTPDDTLYVNWAVVNNGDGITAATFYTQLYVDGTLKNTWNTDPPMNPNTYTSVTGYKIGSLPAGTHTLKIMTDSTNAIAETSETDNQYTKTITVAPLPNLMPYQPSGWSDRIVVTTSGTTTTDARNITSNDNLYVDWAVINKGDLATTATFSTQLYVDGALKNTWNTDPPFAPNAYRAVTGYNLGPLSAGFHTLTIKVDSTNAIAESSETDNQYSRTLAVAVPGSWTPLTHPLPGAGGSHCMLLTDGRVMCQLSAPAYWFALTPTNTGDYINGTWTQMASPSLYSPVYYSSAVLADGRLLVMGGEYEGDTVYSKKGAIYDPVANQWTAVAAPDGWTTIGDAMGIVLPDGTYMQSDCCSGKYALLNPKTMAWTPVSATQLDNFNDEEGWVLLPDGSLLNVDVWYGSNLNQTERFIPSSGNWVSSGSTPASLSDNGNSPFHSHEIGPGVLRPDGTVFWIGTVPTTTDTGHTAIYNTASGTWSAGPDIPNHEGANDAPAAVLPNGNVIAQLSPAYSGGVYSEPSHFYVFDGTNLLPATSPASTSCTPDCSFASYQGNMLVLPTGQVLLTETFEFVSPNVQVYTSPGAPNSAWRPTISSMPSLIQPGMTYSISGTQFNGLGVGASYGDDAQSATNYPLLRITNRSTNHVLYARTHNHSSMGVSTGSLTVSTQFDVPAGIETGLSDIEVVANGIASLKSQVDVETYGPPLTTTAAANITMNAATLNGSVNPNSLSTTAYFQYGATTAYGNTAGSFNLPSGTSATPLNYTVSTLNCNTTYHFRMAAQNSAGTTYGADTTFSTSACTGPGATTGSATSMTQTSATLNGTVNPNGFSSNGYFQYGATTAYGKTTASAGLGTGTTAIPLSQTIFGLSCGTTYHFRAVGQDTAGPSYGADAILSTVSCPRRGQITSQ